MIANKHTASNTNRLASIAFDQVDYQHHYQPGKHYLSIKQIVYNEAFLINLSTWLTAALSQAKNNNKIAKHEPKYTFWQRFVLVNVNNDKTKINKFAITLTADNKPLF